MSAAESLFSHSAVEEGAGRFLRGPQFTEAGLFDPEKIAAAVGVSVDEVTKAVGLGDDALQDPARLRSDEAQRRLRDMVRVLERLEPRFNTPLMAYSWSWYLSKHLIGLGNITAMELVRQNKAQWVLDYIEAVEAGVFA